MYRWPGSHGIYVPLAPVPLLLLVFGVPVDICEIIRSISINYIAHVFLIEFITFLSLKFYFDSRVSLAIIARYFRQIEHFAFAAYYESEGNLISLVLNN